MADHREQNSTPGDTGSRALVNMDLCYFEDDPAGVPGVFRSREFFVLFAVKKDKEIV